MAALESGPPGRAPGGLVERQVVHYAPGDLKAQARRDLVVEEAPLQVRLASDPWLTTMRTPGRDRELALGLLLSEGLIAGLADVGRVVHCGRPTDPDFGHVVDVSPGPGFAFDPERVLSAQRDSHAGCGVCGRQAIDDLLARCPRLPVGEACALSLVFDAQAALCAGQAQFQATGGCHAAVALDREGRALAHAEDVGRHNAVDKLLGSLLLSGHIGARARGPAPAVLAVSGRASFELVHKALVGGCRVLASVSAPSSLAVDLAEAGGLCLLGFVREGHCNLYAHPEGVVP